IYIQELGLSHEVNGQVIALTALATAIILVPAGIMSDKLGRKRVMIFGVLLTGLILFFRSIVEAQTLLLLTGFATGIFTAFLQVSSIPWLAENSNPKQRVHLFSLHSAIMTAANVIGSLLGGTLTDFFTLFTTELSSIRITLIIGSIFYILAFFPILKMVEKQKQKWDKTEKIPFKEFFRSNKTGFKIIILFAIS